MWVDSYASVKIVHDQKIEEALEHSRFFTESRKQKHTLIQVVGTLLARLGTFSAQKPKATSPCCDRQAKGLVS
jgi:hypothetical protein